MIVATHHLGEGVRFYRGARAATQQPVFEPGVPVSLPTTPLTGVDWNHDSLTDIFLIDKTKTGSWGLSIVECQGKNPPVFSKPQPLQEAHTCKSLASAKFLSARTNGKCVDVVIGGLDFQDYWPNGSDPRHADNDEKVDIIYSDFIGNFFFAKKTVSESRMSYLDPVTLHLENGQRLRSPQCMVRGMAIDWNADRMEDLLFGCEDGFIYVSLNVGTHSGKPVFRAPTRVQQKRPPLDFGVAAVPAPCDIDGDGDTDLIVGNASGEILISTNEGTNDRPAFSQPVACMSAGKPFRIENGRIHYYPQHVLRW